MTAPQSTVSARLPSVTDVQGQIDRLTAQLNALDTQQPFGALKSSLIPNGIPANSSNGFDLSIKSPFFTFQGQRQRLEAQIAAQQKVLDSLKNPTDQSGVPPAPDAAPVLGPSISMPKVGINDLKIPLPR